MLSGLPDLAAEHLFQNGGCRCQILGYFGDKFLGIECTLEAETSVSNFTQCKLFIGDDKTKYAFWSDLRLKSTGGRGWAGAERGWFISF